MSLLMQVFGHWLKYMTTYDFDLIVGLDEKESAK